MVARRSVLVIVSLAAVLLLTVSAASASYSTGVIVSLKFPAFHGKVQSNRSSCATNRTVKLFRQKPGRDKFLGTDKSNAKAKWSIPVGKNLASGSYYAKAPAKGQCNPAKSNVVPIA
jgi:hypothetical protein